MILFSLLHSPYPWILLEDLEDCGNVLDGVADDEDGHYQERDLGEVSLPLAQRRVRAPPQCLKHPILISETSLPYFWVKLSCVCLMFAYRKKSNDL